MKRTFCNSRLGPLTLRLAVKARDPDDLVEPLLGLTLGGTSRNTLLRVSLFVYGLARRTSEQSLSSEGKEMVDSSSLNLRGGGSVSSATTSMASKSKYFIESRLFYIDIGGNIIILT